MELTTICLTALIIGFLLIGNSPIQMPREAWGYTLATVFFAVIGGASFFGQIIHTALPALRQTHDTPEDYFEHIAKVLYHGRVKFSAPDHHFNRKFGICCDQEGHCISCLDLQDEEYGEIQAFLRMLHNRFDRRMKEAFAKNEEGGGYRNQNKRNTDRWVTRE